MTLRLKKFLATSFLLLFLLPMVTGIVHPYTHLDDICCTDSRTHFHVTEHHCAICDSVPFIADTPPNQQFFTTALVITCEYVTVYKTPHVFNNDEYSFSLRAPPFVA